MAALRSDEMGTGDPADERVHQDSASECLRLVDVEQVARLLSCSTRHVYRLSDQRRMPPPVKLGGHLVRWNLRELQRWIQAGCPATAIDGREGRVSSAIPSQESE